MCLEVRRDGGTAVYFTEGRAKMQVSSSSGESRVHNNLWKSLIYRDRDHADCSFDECMSGSW